MVLRGYITDIVGHMELPKIQQGVDELITLEDEELLSGFSRSTTLAQLETVASVNVDGFSAERVIQADYGMHDVPETIQVVVDFIYLRYYVKSNGHCNVEPERVLYRWSSCDCEAFRAMPSALQVLGFILIGECIEIDSSEHSVFSCDQGTIRPEFRELLDQLQGVIISNLSRALA